MAPNGTVWSSGCALAGVARLHSRRVGRLDAGGTRADEVAPLIPMLHRSQGTLVVDTPHFVQDRLEPNAMFVHGPQLALVCGKAVATARSSGRKRCLKLACAWGRRRYGAASADERLAAANRPSPVVGRSAAPGAAPSTRRRCVHSSGRAAEPVRSAPHAARRDTLWSRAVGVAVPDATGL